jgi:hypothetical protein
MCAIASRLAASLSPEPTELHLSGRAARAPARARGEGGTTMKIKTQVKAGGIMLAD